MALCKIFDFIPLQRCTPRTIPDIMIMQPWSVGSLKSSAPVVHKIALYAWYARTFHAPAICMKHCNSHRNVSCWYDMSQNGYVAPGKLPIWAPGRYLPSALCGAGKRDTHMHWDDMREALFWTGLVLQSAFIKHWVFVEKRKREAWKSRS